MFNSLVSDDDDVVSSLQQRLSQAPDVCLHAPGVREEEVRDHTNAMARWVRHGEIQRKRGTIEVEETVNFKYDQQEILFPFFFFSIFYLQYAGIHN